MKIETSKLQKNGVILWRAEAWQGSALIAEAERATMADATRAVMIECRRPAPQRERRAATWQR